MLETAAVGDVLDRQSGFAFQQVSCPLHLDLQHVGGGGGGACDGHEFPVELAGTHAEFLGQRVHIQPPFVQELIDEIDRLGQSLPAVGGIAHGVSARELRPDVGGNVAVVLDDEQAALVVVALAVRRGCFRFGQEQRALHTMNCELRTLNFVPYRYPDMERRASPLRAVSDGFEDIFLAVVQLLYRQTDAGQRVERAADEAFVARLPVQFQAFARVFQRPPNTRQAYPRCRRAYGPWS